MPNQPFTPSTPTSGPAQVPASEAASASTRRHPNTVEVTLLPGKSAVVHRVKYTASDKPGEPTVLTVDKALAEQLIKDGVAR